MTGSVNSHSSTTRNLPVARSKGAIATYPHATSGKRVYLPSRKRCVDRRKSDAPKAESRRRGPLCYSRLCLRRLPRFPVKLKKLESSRHLQGGQPVFSTVCPETRDDPAAEEDLEKAALRGSGRVKNTTFGIDGRLTGSVSVVVEPVKGTVFPERIGLFAEGLMHIDAFELGAWSYVLELRVGRTASFHGSP